MKPILSFRQPAVLVLVLLCSCAKNISSVEPSSTAAANLAVTDLKIECIPYGLAPSGNANLELTRPIVNVVGAGTKILFAGGKAAGAPLALVDIYDINTHYWSSGGLSTPRENMSSVSTGTKIMFAGGDDPQPGYAYYPPNIDIYDVATNSWSQNTLTVPRQSMAAVGFAGKIYLAGGLNETGFLSRIDIYDINSGTWSMATLSQPRSNCGAAAIDNTILFAGGKKTFTEGASARVDLHDITSGQWTTSSLSKARIGAAGAGLGNIVIFGGGLLSGGSTATDVYDMYNSFTKKWTSGHLSKKRGQPFAAAIGTKIIIGGGDNTFDCYDVCSGGWGVIQIPVGVAGPSIGAGVAGNILALSQQLGGPGVQFFTSARFILQ